MQCDGGTTELKVAKAILDEGYRAVAGQGRKDFSPPQIVEDGRNRCR